MDSRLGRVTALISILLVCCGGAMGQTARGAQSEAKRLRAFLAGDWKYWMTEYPEFATLVGYPGQNARWTDDSPAAIERRQRHLRESLKKLQTIGRTKLLPEDQLSYDLYQQLLVTAIDGLRFHYDALPLPGVTPRHLLMSQNQLDGIAQDIPRVIAIMPAEDARDYENIITRLEGVPVVVEQTMALLEEGVRRGWTPPRITLRDVPKQVESLIVADAMASPLLRAFLSFPAAVPEAAREPLRRRAVAAYNEKVVPALRKFHTFLAKTYLPACREAIAASALPGGAEWYARNVRWYTTTKLTPREVHEIGLAEVKRIRAEMESIIVKSGFRGTFDEFAGFLRKDSRFYFSDAESLVSAYRDISKRADPELARLFGRLPRLPYGVKPVPAHAAPSQTTAYYEPGSVNAGRPGYFFVNTYNLPARPKYEMEALSLHEAVPGHHLQIALAQELEDVPEFRKHSGYTAYVEGWALYAEKLGEEMGFYPDSYSKYGQLTYEMWRAIRLVVDTGMHAMGWSREQAIEFFKANAAKTEHDIVVEVDRYIVWPGQALGYKIGELKIRELRRGAERELAERFNVRAFHDEVLAAGPLPLDLLGKRMRAWIAREKRKAPAGP